MASQQDSDTEFFDCVDTLNTDDSRVPPSNRPIEQLKACTRTEPHDTTDTNSLSSSDEGDDYFFQHEEPSDLCRLQAHHLVSKRPTPISRVSDLKAPSDVSSDALSLDGGLSHGDDGTTSALSGGPVFSGSAREPKVVSDLPNDPDIYTVVPEFAETSNEPESTEHFETTEEVEADVASIRNRADIENELSDAEKEERRESALVMKKAGNDCFALGDYDNAIMQYSDALDLCPLCYTDDRAVCFANRAACHMKLDQLDDAIEDCSRTLELNAEHAKALYRRAWCYERKGEESWEKAQDDYQQLLRLQPDNVQARTALATLPGKIAERNERMKEDMIGKLKDLGNMCLRPFGLSTDNFELKEQNGGGYSIQMRK